MENINLKIAEVDSALTYYLQQLPVGVAYYILKDKVKQLEVLYYNQAKKQQEQLKSSEEENNTEGVNE